MENKRKDIDGWARVYTVSYSLNPVTVTFEVNEVPKVRVGIVTRSRRRIMFVMR